MSEVRESGSGGLKAGMLRVVPAVLLLAVTAILLAACGGPGAPKGADKIRIGVLGPLSGPFASGGKAMLQSLEIAVEDINAAGGILGRQVELVQGDTQSKGDLARSEALRLVEKEKVQALVGAYLSEETNEVAEVAAEKKMVLVVPVSATNEITARVAADYNRYRYVFRVSYNIGQWAELMGSFIKDQKIKNYAFAGVNIRWNHELAEALKEYLAGYGITPVYEEYYSSKDPAYDAMLTAIKEKKPQLVVAGDPGQGSVGFLKRARDLALQAPVFSVGGALGDARVAGTLPPGSPLYFQAAAWNNTEAGKKYFEKFQAKFGYQPVGYSDTVSYDALAVLAQAMNRAGSLEAEKVIKALEAGGFKGNCGVYSFDRSHQAEWGPGKGLQGVVVEWRGAVAEVRR
ncbi:MAG: ABC transporter substrate-binding protein [Peptococcaceae bacterium]|nr:ABC transporter substrate-binding protein [Peptococcaceae bacterium]